MAFPINLSVTGKPSPRTHDRIGSASNKKPLVRNKERNLTSNVFEKCNKKSQVKPHGVISKSQLESVHSLTVDKKKDGEATYPSPRKLAPDGVPQLQLDAFEEKDEDLSYSKLSPKGTKSSPNSKDTFSWGTPLHVKHSVKGGGWQVHQSRQQPIDRSSHRRDDVPQLNLQLSNTNEGLQQLRKVAKEVREETHVNYFSKQNERNNSFINQSTKSEKRVVEREKQEGKKAAFIEDTFLMDQMLHSKITDEKPPSMSDYALANQQRYNSKEKRHRDMHSTSAASTADINENLTRRLPFAARILSIDGRDARRDINGFYFIDESSITIYEYKQFGTKSKALPLIKRGVYNHLHGVRRPRPYSILDIAVGRDICFRTCDHTILPENLRKKSVIVFRITSVNDEEKERLLHMACGCNKNERIPAVLRMKASHEKEDVIDQQNNEVIFTLQKRLQKQIRPHATRLLTNLYKNFNKFDRENTGFLSKTDYESVLKTFRLGISAEELDNIVSHADKIGDGSFDYGDFVRACFGCPNEQRKYWIRKAFSRLDPSKTGTANLNDVEKFYAASKDSQVTAGKITQSQAVEAICECLQENAKKIDFSFTVFEAYYDGMSLSYSDDNEFIDVIRNTWTL